MLKVVYLLCKIVFTLLKNMKEIEIKAKIGDIEKMREKLLALGCEFSEPLFQKDVVFLPVGVEFSNIVVGTPVVRIRLSNDKATLTLKKKISQGSELIKLEKEVIVGDKNVARGIVEQMGFHEVIRVSRKRAECGYRDMTICLDEVFGLGSFIEVEKMSADDDGEKIQKYLFGFLQTLGIGESEKVTKGYDTLLYEKAKK